MGTSPEVVAVPAPTVSSKSVSTVGEDPFKVSEPEKGPTKGAEENNNEVDDTEMTVLSDTEGVCPVAVTLPVDGCLTWLSMLFGAYPVKEVAVPVGIFTHQLAMAFASGA